MWNHNKSWLHRYGSPDVLLFCGDGIDGKGKRSGGTELLTTDRHAQADMATELLAMWKAERVCMVYGTPYHTGDDEDWERIIAKNLDAEIHGQMFVKVNGLNFHMKHNVGSSTIPHGRHTAVAKDRMWLQLWEDAADWPKADVILRGHVHYHQFCGGPDWLGMTLPALQAAGTKYGSRQCLGIVHFGIVVFDVAPDGTYDWHAETVVIRAQAPTVVTV